jgi:methionine-gamma-lyase
MAAMTAVFMAARQIGRHIVAVRPLYGTTDHLLSSGLLDVDVTYAEPDAVGEALRPDTSLVVIETPANPTLDLVDIRAVSDQIPNASDVALMVDSTFAPPVLQRPLDRGADLSLHSATKFLGGHGDVIAGVVSTGDESWAERLRHVRVVTGGLLHPNAAYLLHRSLPTLPQRVERAQENASALAGRLLDDDRVSGVRYPGLTHGADLVQRQMSGPGTMVAFEMETYESAREVLRGVDLITAAVSLGSVDTLLQHPASLTHGVVDEETKAKTGITPKLLRLSVGLESADDLWEDLSAALDAAVPAEATAAA